MLKDGNIKEQAEGIRELRKRSGTEVGDNSGQWY